VATVDAPAFQTAILCCVMPCVATPHRPCCAAAQHQVAFKGYEEARVALTTLLFAMPCCVIIGVEYGVFMNGKLKTVRRAAAA
jgi:hypothetical protein